METKRESEQSRQRQMDGVKRGMGEGEMAAGERPLWMTVVAHFGVALRRGKVLMTHGPILRIITLCMCGSVRVHEPLVLLTENFITICSHTCLFV